jgi:hypothetical protein
MPEQTLGLVHSGSPQGLELEYAQLVVEPLLLELR